MAENDTFNTNLHISLGRVLIRAPVEKIPSIIQGPYLNVNCGCMVSTC